MNVGPSSAGGVNAVTAGVTGVTVERDGRKSAEEDNGMVEIYSRGA